MKKAFLDQMFLAWIAISAIVIFVATLSDETSAKNKYYDLSDLADDTMNALAREYFKNMQGDLNSGNTITVTTAICSSEDKVNNLLQASSLGNELFSNNKIQFTWRDAGTYNSTTGIYDGVPDGRPDNITVTIGSYTKSNFWYRLLGKDSFELPGFTKSTDLNRFSYNVNVNFRGVIEAGYYNMVGTYTLDNNGCPQNPQLILANKDDWASRIGEVMANIQMPDTKMFFIADGYRRFGNYNSWTKRNSTISLNTTLNFDNNGSSDCTNGTSFPTVVLTTDDGQVQRSDDGDVTGKNLTSRANVYFQDNYLNFDNQAEHTREIAEKDWGAFNVVTESESDWNQEARDYYNSLSGPERFYNGQDMKNTSTNIDTWDSYVQDRGLTPEFDPNNSYVFASEDLASTTDTNDDGNWWFPGDFSNNHDEWNSDRDFSDMSFSMLKLFIPEPIDTSLIESNSIINVNCP